MAPRRAGAARWMQRALALLSLTGSAQAAVVLRGHAQEESSKASVPLAVGPSECQALQDAILFDPKPTCRASEFASEWLGCTCEIPLPANLDQLPNMGYDPYAIDTSSGKAKNGYTSLSFLPPPANPAMPYNAPPMPAECPFAHACGANGGFNCVGFDSFGFTSAHIAEYSPAATYLRTMSCSYMMKKDGTFKVPAKVKSYKRMKQQRDDVDMAAKQTLDAVCPGLPSGTTLNDFCQALFQKRSTMCEWTWAELTKPCSKATPPIGAAASTQGFHLCPFECEDPHHTGYGPGNYKAAVQQSR